MLSYLESIYNVIDFGRDGIIIDLEYVREEVEKQIFSCLGINEIKDQTIFRFRILMSRLDQIWKIYDMSAYSISYKKTLSTYLSKFLLSTETYYYLTGKTDFIHGISLPDKELSDSLLGARKNGVDISIFPVYKTTDEDNTDYYIIIKDLILKENYTKEIILCVTYQMILCMSLGISETFIHPNPYN